MINRNRKDLDSDTQMKLADLQKQYVAVTSTAELMDEYKNGLIPQSEAAFRSEQGAYRRINRSLRRYSLPLWTY